MKKSITCLLLLIALVTALPFTAAAADAPLLYDEADLLTAAEEEALLSRLEQLSRTEQMDVAIVIMNSIGGSTPMEYADDYYDYNGFGYGANRDGLVLLISMEYGDWYISTCGKAISVFTDAGIEYMGEHFVPYLSDGEFYNAFNEYADLCDAFIQQAKTGDPYDIHNLPKDPFDAGTSLVIALVIGFLIAKMYTGKLKKQLNTVSKQTRASNYVKEDEMNLTTCTDLFLYRTLDRTERVQESDEGGSSTHRSSSGATHGGRGGKF